MTTYTRNRTEIVNTCFANNLTITEVELLNNPWYNNSGERIFYNCRNLVKVSGLSDNITNLYAGFYNCVKLNSVVLPKNIVEMVDAFIYCNFINTPDLSKCTKLVNLFETFKGCTNLTTLPPVIPNSVENMDMTFTWCNKLSGTTHILSPKIIDVGVAFWGSYQKNIYIPFGNTATYRSFIGANYKTDGSVNGVYLKEDTTNFTSTGDWYHHRNNSTLCGYIGNDTNVTIPSSINELNTTVIAPLFFNNKDIVSVNYNNIPVENNSLSRAFYKCDNLSSVENINPDITEMNYTFGYCTNLTSAPSIPNSVVNMNGTYVYCTNLVNAPSIPNSVVNMYQTFVGCSNLVNVPEIPNSVSNMYFAFNRCSRLVDAPKLSNSVTSLGYTFGECTNLVNAPEIPNSVFQMSSTFMNCSSLVEAPIIPDSVQRMSRTFLGCSSLTGNIFIQSNQINLATQCFMNTSLIKNVYIPFKYDNGEYTTTYNTFITAYSQNTVNGTVVGTITRDNNGVASGFSDSNYVVYGNPTFYSNHWEMQLKFTANPSSNWFKLTGSQSDFKGGSSFGLSSANKFQWEATTNGSSWDINFVVDDITIQANTFYWVRFGWTGSIYYLDVSTDGINFIRKNSVSKTSPLVYTQPLWIGRTWTDTSYNRYWRGTVDFKECYIKVNDQIVWDGIQYINGVHLKELPNIPNPNVGEKIGLNITTVTGE